jgi:hypothetical protein
LCGLKDAVKQPRNSRHSFIESSVTDSASEYSSSSTKRSLTPELVNDNKYGMMHTNKFPSSISSPNLAKQDSGSSSTASSSLRVANGLDLNNLSEDYSLGIARRERENEERRMSGSRMTQTSSSGSGTMETRTTPRSNRKKTVMLPTAPNRDIKPSTILSLPDRDLIVIDKQDIKEAVRNESDVIIVDPPTMPNSTPSDGNNHTELSDLLGNDWPELAGSSASILNNEKKLNNISNNGYRSIERNKSANLASHLNSKTRYDSQNGYRKSK